MIYVLLGSDDYTKKEFISGLVLKEKADVIKILPDMGDHALVSASQDADIFSSKKIIVAYDLLSKTGVLELLDKLSASKHHIIFAEESLDKRKSENKKLLADKRLEVKEFKTPNALELKRWIVEKLKDYELKLAPKALQIFLERLGAGQNEQGKELYNLWQVDSELRKLKIYAGENEVQPADIENLVAENLDDDIFKITNAIGDKNKALAVKYLDTYIDRVPGADEKSKIINLSALLAEQFRSLLMIQDMFDHNMPEEAVMQETGFSSGRLYVYKKLARGFDKKKLIEILRKFEFLDEEIKTSSGPAALQFYMIIESALR